METKLYILKLVFFLGCILVGIVFKITIQSKNSIPKINYSISIFCAVLLSVSCIFLMASFTEGRLNLAEYGSYVFAGVAIILLLNLLYIQFYLEKNKFWFCQIKKQLSAAFLFDKNIIFFKIILP